MRIHKVEENEELNEIAQKYGIDKEELERKNFLLNPTGLCKGIELLIPKIRCELCSKRNYQFDILSEKHKNYQRDFKTKNSNLSQNHKKNDKKDVFSIYPKNEKHSVCITGIFREGISEQLLSHTLPYLTYISLPFGNRECRYSDMIKAAGVEKILRINPSCDRASPKEIAEKAISCGFRIVMIDAQDIPAKDGKIIDDIYEELSAHRIGVFLRCKDNFNISCDCILTDSDSSSYERRRLAMPIFYSATKTVDGKDMEIPISDAMAVACKRLVKFNVTQNGCSYECDEGKRHVKVALPSLSLWKKSLDSYDSLGINSFYIDNISSFYPPLFAMLSERYNIIKSFSCTGTLH